MKTTLLALSAFAIVVGCETAPPTASEPAHAPVAAGPSFTGTGACAPHGSVVLFIWNYDWIANGGPTSTNCWNPINTTFVSGTTTCPWASNAFEFGSHGSIDQEFTVPAGWTEPYFDLTYDVDFIDPHYDGAFDKFSLEVRDRTTNAVLATDSWDGSLGGLACEHRVKSWVGNFSEHTIRVRFTGTKDYPDTHVRVRNIVLYQEN